MKCLMKIQPATEKCFADESIHDKDGIERLSMLKNEHSLFKIDQREYERNRIRQLLRSLCRPRQVAVEGGA